MSDVIVETYSDEQPTVLTSEDPNIDVEVYEAGQVATVPVTTTDVVEILLGPQGPAGSSTSFYEHHQATPATVWDVPHGLGYNPGAIRVIDSGGNEWDPNDILYQNVNSLQLAFTVAFGGVAYIS
jgi:hypothetical protein